MVIFDALQSVLSIIIIIGIGYILTWKGWFDEETGKLFTKVVVNVSLPALMLSNLMSTFDRKALLVAIGGVVIPFASMVISFGIAVIVSHLLRIKEGRKGTFQTMFFVSNTIFMGMPVNTALFGELSTSYVLLYYIANTTLFWTLGIYLIQKDGGKRDGGLFSIQTVKCIFTPPLMGFLAAFVLIMLGIKMPRFVMDTAKFLGNMTTPLSLLFIGITFRSISLKDIHFSKDMVAIMLGRFVISPLVVIGLSNLMEAPWIMKAVFTIQAAMPIATQASIVSKAYDADYQYATIMVTVTTTATLIFIPIYRALLG
ncbi:MAG: malate transporter [Clostridiales bacterium GWB2_37_7]|nr:MAG: malate transporter [Clostridiales bacterium GWB2_37_7]